MRTLEYARPRYNGQAQDDTSFSDAALWGRAPRGSGHRAGVAAVSRSGGGNTAKRASASWRSTEWSTIGAG